jgi:DNA-binding NarL/FixJ family response regulator
MREPLALAVKDIDRARGKLRRLDADEAVGAWTAMVEGRWTLVDRVERDRKRFVLAYRNEPGCNVGALRCHEGRVATLAALGHSNKYIANELGLAQATVASHVRRALVKLRAVDRRELVAIYGPLARLAKERVTAAG